MSVSDYEKVRKSNVDALLEEYKRTFGESTEPKPHRDQDENVVPKRQRRTYSKKIIQRRLPARRSARLKHKHGEMVEDDLVEGLGEEEGEEYECQVKPKKRSFTPRINLKHTENRYFLKLEEITEEHINSICYKSSGKKYDQANGTTCHQCRQKTVDTKSICRKSTCAGARGQFCGFCLRNRYGEDVAIVLKDPDWSCPPCRGICNCSICRTREGKMPTGILTPYIKNDGYSNVKDYLQKHEDAE